MVSTKIDPAFVEPNTAPAKPELLVSAAQHLMSHYTVHNQERSGCVKLASVIERHPKGFAALPNLEPVLRATWQQLSEKSGSVVESTMPQPEKYTLLSRFVAGRRAY